ncbi:MAG TPA: molecular chaperone TorD family protein [Nitrososphaerales archaeon]|nr:molecular chaperone TorD family protein [Nitrososphaerales archaeon]
MNVVGDKEDTEARAAVYRILSLAFCPPSTETYKIWSALNQLETPDDANGDQFEPDSKALAFEYNRLFVGPERLPCAPYESVHRKDRSEMEIGTVLGPSAFDVQRRYSEAGVETSKNFKDLPDHIAVELEFMHHLCSKELASENTDEAEIFRRMQEEFVEIHLAPWVFAFADKMTCSTNSPFYRKLAWVLRDFVGDEQDYLGVGHG